MPKRDETYRQFQLTAMGILCRTGLELPMICLVTGGTHDIGRITINLVWNSPFTKLILMSRRNRKRFPGLALRTIGHQHGQFEVGGFSSVYLQAIRNRP